MIKILCVGKLKETYWQEAVQEYQKRLSKYTKIEIIEIPDEGILEEELALKKEGEKLQKQISGKDYLITLEIEGKEMNSLAFSQTMDKIFQINSNITFVIGGSFGLSQEIKDQANLKLSFSKLTFPHQLFRVMLLEQIYRSFKISHNESYHK